MSDIDLVIVTAVALLAVLAVVIGMLSRRDRGEAHLDPVEYELRSHAQHGLNSAGCSAAAGLPPNTTDRQEAKASGEAA